MKKMYGAFSIGLLILACGDAGALTKPVWADSGAQVSINANMPTNPDDADRQAIADLKAQGSDITKPTDTIFYFVMPDQASALLVKNEVAGMGFDTSVSPDDQNTHWFVAARKTMVPSEEAIIGLGHKFTSLASAHKGEYDGWEAAHVP